MALTLAEAAKRSNDILQVGVIELLIYQDPVLGKLQFKDIVGNGLTYNVETTMSGANWYNPNDTWDESTSEVTQHTAVTKILGGDADVDNFLKATRSNLQDLMSEQIAAKVKAIKKEFMEMFYYGYYASGAGGDSKGFDGLHYLISSITSPYENAIAVHDSTDGTPAAGCLKELEEAVDLVKNGSPDMILMSKQSRRNLNAYLNSVGGITKGEIQGKTVQMMFEVPVFTSAYISDNESCDDNTHYTSSNYGHDYTDGTALGNGDSGTTVFVLRFAPEAVCGIQSKPITTEKLGNLETKDASRVRIKWYPGLMLQSIITVAKYSGISNATWTVT